PIVQLHLYSYAFLSLPLPHPRSPRFPYTTLFRSSRSPNRSVASRAISLRFPCNSQDTVRTVLYPPGLFARLNSRQRTASRTCKPDRKSTRLNSSHVAISYAVFCLKKKKK